MFGLIWVVQLVHYPAFLFVERERFREFAKFHVDRISFIVVPVMFLEIFTGAALFLLRWREYDRIWYIVGFALIVAIWMVTVTVSVPAHRRLLQGFDEATIRRLIRWNWLRTIMWTVRAVGLVWVLLKMTRGS